MKNKNKPLVNNNNIRAFFGFSQASWGKARTNIIPSADKLQLSMKLCKQGRLDGLPLNPSHIYIDKLHCVTSKLDNQEI
jgi:hypothetical protein